MYGAIFGDIVGSSYEFKEREHTKLFRLFTEESHFTDDTVMTLAVAKSLIEVGPMASEEEIKSKLIFNFRGFAKQFPNAGYGRMFWDWVNGDSDEGYESYGNGSAMRVSSVGWLYDNLDRTRAVARWSAEVTHNHPEGVKGAEAVATVIFLARNGWNAATIKFFVEREFGYDLSHSIQEMAQDYKGDATCQNTVPQAIRAFLEAEDYEDAIRGAVSLGGDSDTLACMAGAMAEARFGIPEEFREEVNDYLAENMVKLLSTIDNIKKDLEDHRNIELMIHNLHEEQKKYQSQGADGSEASKEMEQAIGLALRHVAHAIHVRMNAGCMFFAPVELPEEELASLQDKFALGSVIPLTSNLHPGRRSIASPDGKRWLAAFTSIDEGNKRKPDCYYVGEPIRFTLEVSMQLPDCAGIVVNAWGESFFMPKEIIANLLGKEGPEVNHDQDKR
ncbi:MAG: ADP-ribosylglycohydrolase family protein [Lachnospiraceae bacterium]|nr:ADP-ribosylglycohydrolase family protein [Lachnospiraceae bacterium]